MQGQDGDRGSFSTRNVGRQPSKELVRKGAMGEGTEKVETEAYFQTVIGINALSPQIHVCCTNFLLADDQTRTLLADTNDNTLQQKLVYPERRYQDVLKN